jgi:hypothetical protein
MTAIDQIQLKYNAVADRVLLRISTTGAAEFRFWLTRRFTKKAWPALVDSLAKGPQMENAVSPLARRELLAFRHEQAVTGADFSVPFRDTNQALPLGPEPLLVAKLQIRPAANGHGRLLAFVPETGQGIEVTLTETLMHSFCALLGRVIATTDWDITSPLQVPTSSFGTTVN